MLSANNNWYYAEFCLDSVVTQKESDACWKKNKT